MDTKQVKLLREQIREEIKHNRLSETSLGNDARKVLEHFPQRGYLH